MNKTMFQKIIRTIKTNDIKFVRTPSKDTYTVYDKNGKVLITVESAWDIDEHRITVDGKTVLYLAANTIVNDPIIINEILIACANRNIDLRLARLCEPKTM